MERGWSWPTHRPAWLGWMGETPPLPADVRALLDARACEEQRADEDALFDALAARDDEVAWGQQVLVEAQFARTLAGSW
jgi:hypothetical protein